MPRKEISFPRTMHSVPESIIENLIESALREDLGSRGDITVQALLADTQEQRNAVIVAKEDGVICGAGIAARVFEKVDPQLKIEILMNDSSIVTKGDIIMKVSGSAGSITSAERTALNFLGFLSGISTRTHQLTQILKNSPTRLLDTRKTIPGLRDLQKYAVFCGGGSNHRIGLFDMILIKENHIAAAGGVTEAVRRARAFDPDGVVEVETETLEQVREALCTDADIVMLDNMDNAMVEKAFAILSGSKYVEVSGNVNEKRLEELARIGVDFVSMGGLTHTLKPLDLSLLIKS